MHDKAIYVLKLSNTWSTQSKGRNYVYLEPLVDDLKKLWTDVETYDISRKKNFIIRASLMWTINDFPAYGMLSSWGT